MWEESLHLFSVFLMGVTEIITAVNFSIVPSMHFVTTSIIS